jgi:CelD/BcsL family acetyltransferase involved in cellulose biosynthesis
VALIQRAERIDAEGLRDPKLLDAWRALAVICANPFLTPEWFRTALEAFPDEAAFAIGWWVGEELRGVLPLVIGSKGPLKVLRFPNFRRGDWFGPACRPEDEVAMAGDCAELLRREAAAWNVIRLDRFEVSSAWPQALAGERSPLSMGPCRRADTLPFIAFGEGGYEEWLASRSKSFRRNTKRRRKLERDHGLSFRMTASAAELEPDMDTFFRLHDERWSGRGGSTMATPLSRRLMTSFAASMLELGWLRLWTAELDGEPTAAWYGWRIGERYCFSLSGMSQKHEREGVGTILIAHTVEQAAAEGAAIYDMMWGDEGYKKRFENGRREVETWFLGAGAPTNAMLSAAVGGVKALESLPPWMRRPLRGMKKALHFL